MNRLPRDFWPSVFGNERPVEIEVGPGMGAFLLSIAPKMPDTNFFAIERSHRSYRFLQALLAERSLPNARLIRGDAACLITNLLPAACVAAYHIYFPDPWWKRKHFSRRLLTPDFARELHRTLVPTGRVNFGTDVEMVDAIAEESLVASGWFRRDEKAETPRSVVTKFERKGLEKGSRIFNAVFLPVSNGSK